jgi:hypothetical protein
LGEIAWANWDGSIWRSSPLGTPLQATLESPPPDGQPYYLFPDYRLPGSGVYEVNAWAIDTARNEHQTPASVIFFVSGG